MFVIRAFSNLMIIIEKVREKSNLEFILSKSSKDSGNTKVEKYVPYLKKSRIDDSASFLPVTYYLIII